MKSLQELDLEANKVILSTTWQFPRSCSSIWCKCHITLDRGSSFGHRSHDFAENSVSFFQPDQSKPNVLSSFLFFLLFWEHVFIFSCCVSFSYISVLPDTSQRTKRAQQFRKAYTEQKSVKNNTRRAQGILNYTQSIVDVKVLSVELVYRILNGWLI